MIDIRPILVGRRSYLHPHVDGFCLLGGRSGCVESPDRRMVDGISSAHGVSLGRAQYGLGPGENNTGDSSFGSGIAIHRDCI